ncbi:CPBP family intramembrane glutamic endopeptidase [Ancylomarina sp. YFZ004]
MYRFKRVYISWTNLNPFLFVLLTGFMVFILKFIYIPIFYLFRIYDIGGIDPDSLGTVEYIFVAIVFAPIIETLLAQYIPILLFQKLLKKHANLIGIIVSVIIFSLMHISFSITYALIVIPAGIFLALTFVIFQKRRESSFWMTSFVHAFINLMTLSVTFLDLF